MGSGTKHTTGSLEGTQLVASQGHRFRAQGASPYRKFLSKNKTPAVPQSTYNPHLSAKYFFSLPEIESLFHA